jgi:hypothetical protein
MTSAQSPALRLRTALLAATVSKTTSSEHSSARQVGLTTRVASIPIVVPGSFVRQAAFVLQRARGEVSQALGPYKLS